MRISYKKSNDIERTTLPGTVINALACYSNLSCYEYIEFINFTLHGNLSLYKDNQHIILYKVKQ